MIARRLRTDPDTPATSMLDAGIRLYTHTQATDNTERLLGHSGVRLGCTLQDGFLDRMIPPVERLGGAACFVSDGYTADPRRTGSGRESEAIFLSSDLASL